MYKVYALRNYTDCITYMFVYYPDFYYNVLLNLQNY
jgi:hypothetical protein